MAVVEHSHLTSDPNSLEALFSRNAFKYDVNEPPVGKQVNEGELQAFLEQMRDFRTRSENAGAFMVFGGQVAVNQAK